MTTRLPVRIRPEQPTDRAAVDQLVREAFGGERVASLLASMRGDHSWVDLSFVAEVDGHPDAPAGHVAFTRGWVDAPQELAHVLVLSPLAVQPHLQRRGVGEALLEGAFRMLQGRNEPLVFLEGDPRYYQRHGFEPAEPLGFVRPSLRIPQAAFQVRRLAVDATDLTGQLVYPDVFWRHDAVGLRG